MSGIEYIDVPIESDPDSIAQDGFDYLQAVIPGWQPNDANLETIMVEAVARITSNALDTASAVPNSIFRKFGELVNILPQEAVAASSTVTFHVRDTAGYTIPAGTQVAIQQTGDVLVPFQTTISAVIAPGTNSITGVTIQAIDTGAANNGLSGTITLLDTLDFVTSVVLEADTSSGFDAEDNDTYLNRLRARLQLLAPRPILAKDFAVIAQDIAGVDRAVALDGYDPEHNLMSANESSLETSVADWSADTNCTVAQVTTQAQDGTHSLRIRSAASGNMIAVNTPVTLHVVLPGEQITAMASFRAAASARTCRIDLSWYTSGSAHISDTTGTGVADTTSGWTAVHVVGSAPGNAAYVVIKLNVLSTGGATEDHYVDEIALRHGNYFSNWKIGGSSETGNDRMVAVAAVDVDGVAISSGLKTQVDDYLEALREVNFIVNVIDPIYTSIDVTTTVKAAVGFNTTDVQSAVNAALTAYLSPNNWGLFGATGDSTVNPDWQNKTVVRYLELAQVINDVAGVDYISALQLRVAGGTLASADVTLGGAVPLPNAGTITTTVT